MSALVYFEVLGTGEHLAASLERARERFLAGVHPDVVDQLVFGLERPALALAPEPKARVGRALGPADVLDRDMRHDVLHGAEHLATRAQRRPGLVDPLARHILQRGSRHLAVVPHVPVKRVVAGGPDDATAAVRVLGAGAITVVVVPVHRAGGGRGDGQRRWRRLRRVNLIVMVVMMVVQLKIVVYGRVQSAQMVLTGVLMVVMPVGMVVPDVPADVQEIPGSRVSRMVRRRRRRWRLTVVHMMVLVLWRRRHVIVLDLDAHTVSRMRVVHKRV